VRVRLEAQGRTISMADSLIAGIVLAHGGLLLTRNLGHFERVEGLALARLSGDG
jgi:predicted nucleic acid-binding protein